EEGSGQEGSGQEASRQEGSGQEGSGQEGRSEEGRGRRGDRDGVIHRPIDGAQQDGGPSPLEVAARRRHGVDRANGPRAVRPSPGGAAMMSLRGRSLRRGSERHTGPADASPSGSPPRVPRRSRWSARRRPPPAGEHVEERQMFTAP